MSVGAQTTNFTMDGTLTTLAVKLREIMTDIENLNTQVTSGGNTLAYLESIGYTAADAQTASTYITLMAEIQQAYFGLANIPAANNFNSGLAPLWALQ